MCAELRSRGFAALDTDDGEGLCEWQDAATGEPVEFVPASDRPAGWIDRNHWRMSSERIRELSADATKQQMFVCGSVSNNADVWNLFDGIVFLALDDDQLRTRLTDRTNNDFGKAPGELESMLSLNQTEEREFRGYGAQIVDASRPVSAVVEDVLAATVYSLPT